VRKNVFALLAAAVMAVAPVRLHSQAVGSMVGVVLDPNSAAIPNAKVTALEKNTGFTRATVTSESGNYTLPLLPVGNYTLTAEAPGFQSSSVETKLDVNQRKEVNITMQVSGVDTKIEVTATAPTINTTTGTLGGLVEGRQVASLPLNGRDITNLVLLQPGMQEENNSSFPFNNTTSGNGNRGTTGSGYLDGIDSSDNELGGAQFSNFNLDAIAEFRVLQNNYSAEYGRGSGTIVQLVTKSGTNQFHGSLFEFVRNDKFDARNFFDRELAPFRRNEYGGTFGGPILIPKVYNGKDRTFFFFQAASFRQRKAGPVLFPVPTAEERQGLVDIVGANGAHDQLRVPVLPEVQSILNAYPSANNPNGPFGPRTFAGSYSAAIDRDQYSARIDHRFSSKDSLFARFSHSDNVIPNNSAARAILDTGFANDLKNNWVNFGISETHVFSGSLINEARFGAMLSDEVTIPKRFDVTEVDFADQALQSYGTSGGGFSLRPYTQTYRDGVTWIKGRHSINFGGEYRKVNASYFGSSIGGPNGVFTFAEGSLLPVAIPSVSGANNLQPGDPSPSSLVSFMTGISQFYQRSVAYPGYGPPGGGFAPFSMRRYHWNGWFQDDIKLTRSFTLNLGIRYEYNSVPTETAGRLAGIVDAPDFLNDPSLFRKMVLNPSPIYREDYRGWGPRVGFAWKAVSKTVLRGGLGIFTNLPLSQTADQQGFNFPFSGTSATSNLPFSSAPQPLNQAPIRDLKGNIVPQGGDSKTVPPNTPVDLTPYPGLLTNVTTTNYHNGYTIAGNFTVERELPFDSVLQVGYVFNNAVSLYGSQYPNGYVGADPSLTPFSFASPGLSEFQLTDNHAHSTYNSLQASYRKTVPTAGLTFQLSYTYSRAMDNATTVYNGDSANSAVTQNDPTCWNCERARASFDAPHRIVANFTYQFPFDRMAQHLPKRLTQGWALLGIITANSGFPFTVTTPYGTKRYGIDNYAGGATRPDLLQTPTLKPEGQGADEQFFSNETIADGINYGQKFFGVPLDTLADGTTVQAHPGNLGRNTFRSAGYSKADFSILKDTNITERFTMQFRAEFFNLLNQHAFQRPNAQLGNPGFGIASSTLFDPRELQFGLRLIF
jgi:hypothetical protein